MSAGDEWAGEGQLKDLTDLISAASHMNRDCAERQFGIGVSKT